MRGQAHRTICGRGRRRGFVLSTELVLLLPLVLGLVLAVIEFSLLEVGRQRAMAAARQGARVAALPGSTFEDIDRAVAFGLTSAPLGAARQVRALRGPFTGDPVFVEVRVPMRAAAPDLLGIIGFGLGSRTLVGTSVTRRE